MGQRLAQFLLDTVEADPVGSPLISIARAAASEPAAAVMVRDLVTTRMLTPLTLAIGADNAALRASLLGSQVVGLTFARYIVGIEPLASLTRQETVAAIGPVLQHYLTGDLGLSRPRAVTPGPSPANAPRQPSRPPASAAASPPAGSGPPTTRAAATGAVRLAGRPSNRGRR